MYVCLYIYIYIYIYIHIYIYIYIIIIISYVLLQSAIRPDIQPKSSRSHEAEPSVIWMTGGGWQAGLHFPSGRDEYITCSFMLRKITNTSQKI